MNDRHSHVVFKTAWGFFGLCGRGERLACTVLPIADRSAAAALITARLPDSQYDSAVFADLRERVISYFKGDYVDFSDVPLDLTNMSAFARRVLCACRKIPPGRTASYAGLALLAHSTQAARAAGSVMARNPMPLIVPCHRIIRSDGRIGEFSAPGGPDLKERLLALEARCIRPAVLSSYGC